MAHTRKEDRDPHGPIVRVKLSIVAAVLASPLPRLCVLTIDGAKGGLKRGNTPMMVKECYDGREDRSGEKSPP